MKFIKKLCILLSPLTLFPILLVPYSWINNRFLVDWFGCGCPKVDETGNMIHNYFNANDVTRLFWLFITVCVTILSITFSKKIPQDKRWLKIVYVAAMLLLSLFISFRFIQIMMWQ